MMKIPVPLGGGQEARDIVLETKRTARMQFDRDNAASDIPRAFPPLLVIGKKYNNRKPPGIIPQAAFFMEYE